MMIQRGGALHILFILYVLQLAIFKAQLNFIRSNVTLSVATSHMAAIYNNSLFIIYNSEPIQSIALPLHDNQWIQHQNTSHFMGFYFGYYYENTITIRNELYLLGVLSAQYEYVSLMLLYNLATNELTPLPHRDLFWWLHGSCSVYNAMNHIIYVIGGEENAGGDWHLTHNITQRFNISSNLWITNASNPITAVSFAGCSLNGNNSFIYYFGGFYVNALQGDYGEILAEIQKYDIINDKWEVIAAVLSTRRRRLNCRLLSIDHQIYCIGGDDGLSFASNAVDVFDPKSEAITTQITLNDARAQFTATLWNDDRCIIVSGGYDESLVDLRSIEYIGDCRPSTTSLTTTQSIQSNYNTTQSTASKPNVTFNMNPSSTTNATSITNTNITQLLTSSNPIKPTSVTNPLDINSESTTTHHISIHSTMSITSDNNSNLLLIVVAISISSVLAIIMFVLLYFCYDKTQKNLAKHKDKTKIKEQQNSNNIIEIENNDEGATNNDSEKLYGPGPPTATKRIVDDIIVERDVDDTDEDSEKLYAAVPQPVTKGTLTDDKNTDDVDTAINETKRKNENAYDYGDEGYDFDIDYRNWNATQIVYWIINLDSNKFVEYEDILTVALDEQQINGHSLRNIDASDLNRWGITDLQHIDELMEHIHALVAHKEIDAERYKNTVGYI